VVKNSVKNSPIWIVILIGAKIEWSLASGTFHRWKKVRKNQPKTFLELPYQHNLYTVAIIARIAQ